MTPDDRATGSKAVEVQCLPPFDLGLSLRAMASFARPLGSMAAAAATPGPGAGALGPVPGEASRAAILREGVRIDGQPTLLEIRQVRSTPPVVSGEAHPFPASLESLRELTAKVVNASLDLVPFYETAADHPVFGPLIGRLHGLKAFRPAGLFDMLVTAVVEQQISLVAAQQIRARLVRAFGEEAEGEPVFPTPEALAEAPVEALTACGLSREKAGYVTGVATEIVAGRLDLDALERAPDDEVKTRIVALRGFGPWSADYVLIRGLARPDAVPFDDVAVRSVIGRALGDGSRPSPSQAAALLAPLAPYRGLAAFYLLVAARMW
jgi:DNA-3-methyladenine glycosylase II